MNPELLYHIAPAKGLLNDPNGLIQFRGDYHVFYQWNPTGTVHANKHWNHLISKDMVHWQECPLALAPDQWYDKDGVYSGSAVAYQDRLYLFYTGNVKDENQVRHTYQCLAISDDGLTFEKKGPLFEYPAGYTAHVRDPKVWFDQASGDWLMVLGAQREDLTGDTILYRSPNLLDWTFQGSILQFDQPLGYMWECPDLISLIDEAPLEGQKAKQEVFFFSPQGLESRGMAYHNIYQTCYALGQFQDGQFEPNPVYCQAQNLPEVDKGFEFYAPQTFQAADGRIIQYGWMGIMEPDKEASVPTIARGWIHQLTVPRVLRLKAGQLLQWPVAELESLRKDDNVGKFQLTGQDQAGQLQTTATDWVFALKGGDFSLSLRDEVEISYESESQVFTVERTNWANGQREVRQTILSQPLEDLRLLMEETSLEIFINQGRQVFSLRYFAQEDNRTFSLKAIGSLALYNLA